MKRTIPVIPRAWLVKRYKEDHGVDVSHLFSVNCDTIHVFKHSTTSRKGFRSSILTDRELWDCLSQDDRQSDTQSQESAFQPDPVIK